MLRHGPGHALYTCFRDPDGHRVEIFNTRYQVMDSEIGPVRRDPAYTGISIPLGSPSACVAHRPRLGLAGDILLAALRAHLPGHVADPPALRA